MLFMQSKKKRRCIVKSEGLDAENTHCSILNLCLYIKKKLKQPHDGQKETFLLHSGYSGTGSLLPFSETFGIG